MHLSESVCIWHHSLQLSFSGLVHPSNLISCFNAGVEGMECSLPMDGRRVSLTQLSKDSFRECQATLTLTDLLIIIFSGISVSVVAIMTSFFLASTVHCFQRWSKGTKGDEEESEEWVWGRFALWRGQLGPGTSNNVRTTETVCATFMLLPLWLISRTV